MFKFIELMKKEDDEVLFALATELGHLSPMVIQ